MKQSKTNETTQEIRTFLFRSNVLVWRENSAPIPIQRGGFVTGFRSGGRSGKPDLLGVYPLARFSLGIAFGIEVKTGKDKLRESQISFITEAIESGMVILVVSDFEDFLIKWNNFLEIIKLSTGANLSTNINLSTAKILTKG